MRTLPNDRSVDNQEVAAQASEAPQKQEELSKTKQCDSPAHRRKTKTHHNHRSHSPSQRNLVQRLPRASYPKRQAHPIRTTILRKLRRLYNKMGFRLIQTGQRSGLETPVRRMRLKDSGTPPRHTAPKFEPC